MNRRVGQDRATRKCVTSHLFEIETMLSWELEWTSFKRFICLRNWWFCSPMEGDRILTLGETGWGWQRSTVDVEVDDRLSAVIIFLFHRMGNDSLLTK